MVRHQHPGESNFLVDAHRLQHVDVAVVDERFLEAQEPAANVSEMHVEDLVARTEVADHVVDFFPRFGQHLADRALAEIEAVIRARTDADKPFEAVNVAEYRLNPSKSFPTRHPGILRVTGHPHL